MASPSSSVLAALAGNTFVTLIKVVAFLASGSGAMLSEAIHSGADTANQALLYFGLRRGSRRADEDFHYGYGGERFIFGLLSAAGIFFVGCGVTVYHGIETLRHPVVPEVGLLTVAVLAIAFVIEGTVLLVAVRSMDPHRGAMSRLRFLRERADPATVAIILEDGVAVAGVLVAGAGIAAAKLTGIPYFDGVASILIGLSLGLVAIYLVLENRKLLLGGAVPEEVEAKFIEILRAWPSVMAVRDVKTRQLTPEAYTLKAELVFRAEHFGAILKTKHAEDGHVPSAEDFVDYADTTISALSKDVDELEAAVRAAIPFARHIDIEVDASKAS